jgi:uncharacterized protein (TIGR02391 family)
MFLTAIETNQTMSNAILQNITPIRTFQDGSYAIDCAFCEGRGLFPELPVGDDLDPEPCPVCQGKGINVYRVGLDLLTHCRYCGGNGQNCDRDGYFVGDTCPVCEGTGIVILEANRESFEDRFLRDLLHPKIWGIAEGRFKARQYADSAEAALKHVNAAVKEIVKESTGEEFDGASLMERAFSIKNPLIALADLTTVTGRNEQLGYMQIFAGAMTGIRNPKAHNNLSIDRDEAIHILCLASLLMRKLDGRK